MLHHALHQRYRAMSDMLPFAGKQVPQTGGNASALRYADTWLWVRSYGRVWGASHGGHKASHQGKASGEPKIGVGVLVVRARQGGGEPRI